MYNDCGEILMYDLPKSNPNTLSTDVKLQVMASYASKEATGEIRL